MDGAVRHLIVEPLAVFDFRVGGVRPEDESKHRLETAVHRIDEQPVGVDVFFQHLLRRIAVAHWVGLPESAIAFRAWA